MSILEDDNTTLSRNVGILFSTGPRHIPDKQNTQIAFS
jgi:hypothetical protein